MFMTPTSFAILLILGLIGLAIIWELGGLPGKKAAERNHPQAEAINIAAWLGLALGVILWPLALIWAFMAQQQSADGGDQSAAITRLEERLAAMEARLESSGGQS